MKSISQSVFTWFEHPSVLPAFLDHLVDSARRTIADSRCLLHTAGKLRRFWLVHCRKRYVQTQLLARQGECRQCGVCCNLLFTCPMLTRHGKCIVYGSCRPRSCKVFPIDQHDLDEVDLCGGHCGYHFQR
jgi:hypothetical protein